LDNSKEIIAADLRILFVASECAPFVKTGGLADVIWSLPKSLREIGVDARVILPKYKLLAEKVKNGMHLIHHCEVNVSWRKQYCGIEVYEYQGVPYYFIDNQYYFNRDSIYGYSGAPDEAERFAYFAHAVLSAIPFLDFRPDILHIHDWQTSLIPLFLQKFYQHKDEYKKLKTVLTIHNLHYQGRFNKTILSDVLGLDWGYLTSDELEYYNDVNFLKAGIKYADLITTVSKTYQEEIKYPYYGAGLHDYIAKYQEKIFGIVNGIDVEEYNPEIDPYIYTKYSAYGKKNKNKLALQYDLNLPVNREIPIIVIISRLVEQKGLDLIIHVFNEIMAENVQFIVVGTGEWRYEEFFRQKEKEFPQKVRTYLFFEESFARKVYAGSDFLLMPSRYEPCGLSQMIAIRYLTVPIVRETGGLKDTVVPFNEYTGEGNGFSFSNYNAHDMLFTIRRAIRFYHQPKDWKKIIRNLRHTDVSWDSSAKMYLEIYEKLVEKKNKLSIFA